MPELTILHTLYWSLLVVVVLYALPRAFWIFRQELSAHRNNPDETGAPLPATSPVALGRLSLEHINFIDVVAVLIICGLYYSSGEGRGEITVDVLLLGLVGQLFSIGIIVMIWVFRVNLIEVFGLRKLRLAHLLWVGAILAITWGFTGVVEYLGYFTFLESYYGEPPLQDAVQVLQHTTDPLILALIAVVACIGAPVTEELLFRGYIFPIMSRYTGVIGGVLFSALFFSVIHYNLASFPSLCVMGALLAVAYQRTGTLWVPIIAHALFNSSTVCYQILSRYSEVSAG